MTHYESEIPISYCFYILVNNSFPFIVPDLVRINHPEHNRLLLFSVLLFMILRYFRLVVFKVNFV